MVSRKEIERDEEMDGERRKGEEGREREGERGK